MQQFERWLAAAQPPAKLWRTAFGVVIGLACWLTVSVAVPWAYYAAWMLFGDETSTVFQSELWGLATGSTHLATLVLLLASGGFWLGAYLAAKLMHRQPFGTLLGEGGGIQAQGFILGVLLTAGLLLLEMIWAPFFPSEPYRNETNLARWLLFAPPVVVLVFVQAGGEELFFRGYVMQQLAARFRSPLVWALLPSLVFGLAHAFNGISVEHSVYYVISTVLFGLTAAATVWRTGGLSVAIGMHVSTNVMSFLYSGSDEFFTATPIWLSSVHDQIEAMPFMIASQIVLLAFVLSPWAPLPKRHLFSRKKEIRAAP